jgi:MOSC domain-containing protein YiiM
VRIESVQVGKPVRAAGGMRTAFGKRPVEGAVHVGRDNLEGDRQADRRYHGGPDMAVLAYPADHYRAWRAELAWPELPMGGFGENLSVSGATEETVCLGDVWRAGTARLQVASPRNPCVKIMRYWGRPELLRRVFETGRTGWYLRVLDEGVIEAGGAVELVERMYPAWTVARAGRVAMARRANRSAARELSEVGALPQRWKAWLLG